MRACTCCGSADYDCWVSSLLFPRLLFLAPAFQVTHRDDVQSAVTKIRSSLDKSGSRRALGLSVKSNVGRIPGSPQKYYAVLGLSTGDTAVVFNLYHLSDRRSARAGVATVNLPRPLVELLNDVTVSKVAIRIKEKVTKLSQQFNLLLGGSSIRGEEQAGPCIAPRLRNR